MQIEHIVGLGVVVLLAALAAWIVQKFMCKNEEEDGNESQDEIKSVNSRTKVISAADLDDEFNLNKSYKERYAHANEHLQEVFISKPPTKKKKNSQYVQSSRQARFTDPFGEWTRREKEVDDTETLSGIKSYRKSPVLPHKS